MRLIAVSVVKNEADMIEAFVRHTAAWVDHHLIFDHASTDGTGDILRALQAEGLPVTLFTDAAWGHRQQQRSNRLTRIAAAEFGADWVLPLDADEILCGPDRAGLEAALAALDPGRPASLPLHDYVQTEADDPVEKNPVLRLCYARRHPSGTTKILVPRLLAADEAVTVVKGSHVALRANAAVPDQPLPPGYFLAHFALRSAPHTVIRLVTSQLHKLSRGQAAAGLDQHYRLGFQLLAEDPESFVRIIRSGTEHLSLAPVPYRGGPLRHSADSEWSRVARALLPFLEQLAASHGRLVDRSAPGADEDADAPLLRLPAVTTAEAPVGSEAFGGFTVASGLETPEGPVPEAFLPKFRWGLGPVTTLAIVSPREATAQLEAECLTYSEGQVLTVELNGTSVHAHRFGEVNQKETLRVPLALRQGENILRLRYAEALVSPHDPRPLAVIYLSLRVLPA